MRSSECEYLIAFRFIEVRCSQWNTLFEFYFRVNVQAVGDVLVLVQRLHALTEAFHHTLR